MGTLAGDDLVVLSHQPQRLEAFDAHLQQEHHQVLNKGAAIPALSNFIGFLRLNRQRTGGRTRLPVSHGKMAAGRGNGYESTIAQEHPLWHEPDTTSDDVSGASTIGTWPEAIASHIVFQSGMK